MRDSGVLLEAFAAVADRFVLFQGLPTRIRQKELWSRWHACIKGLACTALPVDIHHVWKKYAAAEFMSCYFKS